MGFCSIAGCFEFCRGRRAPLPSSASGTAASVLGGAGGKQEKLSSRPCRMPQGDGRKITKSFAPLSITFRTDRVFEYSTVQFGGECGTSFESSVLVYA